MGFVDSDCSDLKDEVVGLAKGLINTGEELWGALSHAFTTGDFGTLLNTLAKSTLHIDVQGCISEKDATIAGCIGEATGKIAVQLVAGAGVGKALDKFKDFISSTSTAVDVATNTGGLADDMVVVRGGTSDVPGATGLEAGATNTAGALDEAASGRVTVLGRFRGGTEGYLGKPGFNVLDLPSKGTGRWYWSRNEAFIDDAIAAGDEIRLVNNPFEPIYSGGNTFQRELRYLKDLGYKFEESGDHWVAVPGR